MGSPLSELPSELVAHILAYVSIHDNCNMRLVSRTLSLKATGPSFMKLFHTKSRLLVTPESLMNFIAVTQPSRLGNLLKNLTLVGVSIDYAELGNTVRKQTRSRATFSGGISLTCEDSLSDLELAQAKEDLTTLSMMQKDNLRMYASKECEILLATAFRNLKNNGDGLHYLGLEVVGYRDNIKTQFTPSSYTDSRGIWSTAKKLFYSSMKAILRSELAIANLEIYHTGNCCSLTLSQLDRFTDVELQHIATNLRSLELSVSRSYPLVETIDDTALEPEESFLAINQLISRCSKLQVLKIHYFSLNIRNVDAPYAEEGHAKLTMFPSEHNWADYPPLALKEVCLAGMGMTQAGLLGFLTYHSVEILELNNVILQSGSFKPIFEWINTQTRRMSLNLECLYEKKLVVFPQVTWMRTQDGQLVRCPQAYYNPQLVRFADEETTWEPITYILTDRSHQTRPAQITQFGPLPTR